MGKNLSRLYPTLSAMIDQGVQMELNGGGYPVQIARLYENEKMICQFDCEGMTADSVFKKLEELAARFEKEGIETDNLNGCEHSVW